MSVRTKFNFSTNVKLKKRLGFRAFCSLVLFCKILQRIFRVNSHDAASKTHFDVFVCILIIRWLYRFPRNGIPCPPVKKFDFFTFIYSVKIQSDMDFVSPHRVVSIFPILAK